MTQPIWQTPAGNLGTFPSSGIVNYQLHAYASFPGTKVNYQLL